MARIINQEKKPVYLMKDTWKKDNINNTNGYCKKFHNKEDAEEICDLNNIDGFGFYNNRFIIE